MPNPIEKEGEVEFHVPAANKPCKTWYKVVGDLTAGRPLVTLHGGPGATHDYLTSFVDLTSSHDLFCAELENLLRHLGIESDFDLYGHSWGGMLAARFATRKPKGLKRLILADSPASMELWVEAGNKLRKDLPQDVQDTLTKHEQAGTTEDPEYEGAVKKFYEQNLCRLNPWPESIIESFGWLGKDPTVYHTMNGPSEFHIIGTLKTWTVIDELHKIDATTLLINGRYDEAQDSVVEPFFRLIPRSKWVQFAESSHMPHHKERERYMEIVGGFLRN